MRRLFLCVLLLAVGCRAQSPIGAELNRKIEKQVRATFVVPPFVDVKVGDRTPSTDFAGYDRVVVTFTYQGQTQTRELLLNRDGKSLFSVSKMDLTHDPLAETMAKIDLTGRPVRGNKDAQVTVVVFDDFQCPYCSRMHQTLTAMLKSYGDRIKVVYKDFPLIEIHPWAERAAIDSECLAKQSADAYWDFADYVHSNGRRIQGDKKPVDLQIAEVDQIAMEAGNRHSADAAALESCVKAQSKTALKASMNEAASLGIESAPVVFLDGMKMDGAVPEDQMRISLDKELKNVSAAAPAKAAPAPGH